MGSISLTSLLGHGCRSFIAPVALVCTLALTHVALSEHSKSHQHVKVAWFSKRSKKKTRVACESLKEEVTYPTATSSVYGYPLLPCPSQNGPPRVEHLVVSEGGPVLEYICKNLDIPAQFVADLIHFGAVYYALVCPKPPPTAMPEEMRVYKEATAPSVLEKRASIKGKTVREAQKTFRITHVDQFVEDGTYLRVHVHPKRIPRCYEIDWKSRVIAVNEDFVLLDKPAGTTVGGTTDNIEES